MTMKLNFGNNDDGGSVDVAALADKIAELSAENENLKAEMKQLRKELDEAADHVERAEARAKAATEWKNRAEIAEGENTTLKKDVETYKKQVNEMSAGISDRAKPIENLKEAYKTATAKANEIIRDAEALNKAAAEAKAVLEHQETTPKDVVKATIKYSFLGAFLFACAYFGTVKGGMAENIDKIRDLAYRIAWNQYFTPWGMEPISPYLDELTATKIWNDTYNNLKNQTQQQEPEPEQ